MVAKTRYAMFIFILVFLLAMLVPQVAYADTPLPKDCVDIIHHQLSAYAIRALRNGTAQTWKSGGVIIAAIPVVECGGAIMFAKWRYGQLITNFFPGDNNPTVWLQKNAARAYISRQVVGYMKVAASIAARVVLSPPIILVSPSQLCERDASLCTQPNWR
jgi:hypothetical protein